MIVWEYTNYKPESEREKNVRSKSRKIKQKTVNKINHMILLKGYSACNTKINASGLRMSKRELVKIGIGKKKLVLEGPTHPARNL
jgi:hypothetical protein